MANLLDNFDIYHGRNRLGSVNIKHIRTDESGFSKLYSALHGDESYSLQLLQTEAIRSGVVTTRLSEELTPQQLMRKKSIELAMSLLEYGTKQPTPDAVAEMAWRIEKFLTTGE